MLHATATDVKHRAIGMEILPGGRAGRHRAVIATKSDKTAIRWVLPVTMRLMLDLGGSKRREREGRWDE